MGQRQRHRGRHPEDDLLFSSRWLPILRRATADLSFLMTRGYARKAASTLVGDHYQLHARQRRAVLRASCPEESRRFRQAHRVPVSKLAGSILIIDGYNLLVTAESILGGGVLIRGWDGCVRDMASVHGSYRRVEETEQAIHLLGDLMAELRVTQAHWFIDAPVSNSGRLKACLLDMAKKEVWPWQATVTNGVDRLVAVESGVVVTSDSWILDRAAQWTPLIQAFLNRTGGTECVLDLSEEAR